MNRVSEPVDFDNMPPVEPGRRTFGAEWWLALAHLRSKKQEAFVSLVTALAIVGVVAGVMTLNMVIAVMAGFEADLRDKILGANAHVVVLKFNGGPVLDPVKLTEDVRAVDGVAAAAPFVYTEAIIRSNWKHTGIILKGIDPDHTGEVTSVRDDLRQGPTGELTTAYERALLFKAMHEKFPKLGFEATDSGADPLPGILLGTELRKVLQVEPGDEVQVIDPLGGGTGMLGMPTPRVRRFRVAGVFDSGMYEYDTKWTYVANPAAQDFLQIGDAVTGIEIKVDDIDDVEAIGAAIEAKLGYPHYTRHWKELNQQLFAALELEKVVMGLILFLIVGVAALLIVTTLIMMVITKGREIAILKAMGATDGAILRIFVIEGSLIGIVGTALGTIFGLAGCKFLDWYGYPLETDVYFLSELPVVVTAENVVVIALGSLLICFAATLYPAWRAASLDPVEGLRYE